MQRKSLEILPGCKRQSFDAGQYNDTVILSKARVFRWSIPSSKKSRLYPASKIAGIKFVADKFSFGIDQDELSGGEMRHRRRRSADKARHRFAACPGASASSYAADISPDRASRSTTDFVRNTPGRVKSPARIFEPRRRVAPAVTDQLIDALQEMNIGFGFHIERRRAKNRRMKPRPGFRRSDVSAVDMICRRSPARAAHDFPLRAFAVGNVRPLIARNRRGRQPVTLNAKACAVSL